MPVWPRKGFSLDRKRFKKTVLSCYKAVYVNRALLDLDGTASASKFSEVYDHVNNDLPRVLGILATGDLVSAPEQCDHARRSIWLKNKQTVSMYVCTITIFK